MIYLCAAGFVVIFYLVALALCRSAGVMDDKLEREHGIRYSG